MDLSEDHFTDNVAGSAGEEGYGGALFVYYYATLSDQGSTFTGNRVRGKDGLGGAIDDESYQSASLSGTVLTGNSATGATSYGVRYTTTITAVETTEASPSPGTALSTEAVSTPARMGTRSASSTRRSPAIPPSLPALRPAKEAASTPTTLS